MATCIEKMDSRTFKFHMVNWHVKFECPLLMRQQHASPSVWNCNLRLEPDTAVFKRKLNSYLFRSVFTQ